MPPVKNARVVYKQPPLVDADLAQKRVFSGREAARYLGVSYGVLMYFVNTGKLRRRLFPSDRSRDGIMRKVLIDREDLDAFIAARPGPSEEELM